MKRPLIIVALLLSSSGALAQDPAATQPAPISREEYERLLRDQSLREREVVVGGA